MLNIVNAAEYPPAKCIASGSETGPFVDTGMVARGINHVYLSVPYLNTLAAGLGWVPAPELATALEELGDALTEAAELRARVERFDEDVENVTQAMAAFLQQVRNSTGDVTTGD